MRDTAVLFDLDGTLVDSLADIAAAANDVLGELGHPIHPLDAYRRLVGDGARELLRRALPEHAQGALDDALARYRERYRERLLERTRPYPGIAELVGDLRDAGIPCAVVTNKPHELACRLVEALFAPGSFVEVVGQRDGVPHKPDPTGALGVVRRLGVAPGSAWFVGDSATDVRTARAGGMIAVGVLWGFRPRSELVESGARHLVSSPEDIARLVHSAESAEAT